MRNTSPESKPGQHRPAAVLYPPDYLSPVALIKFQDCIRSRPAYYTVADAHLLVAYALCAEEIEEVQRDPVALREQAERYDRLLNRLTKLARALRLSPNTRSSRHDVTPNGDVASATLGALRARPGVALRNDGADNLAADFHPWETPLQIEEPVAASA